MSAHPGLRRKLVISLVCAFLVNLLPLPDIFQYSAKLWRPDCVLLTLLVWTLTLPRIMGLTVAMLVGLAMDIHQQSLLGQQALIYILAVWCAQWMRVRMQFFGPVQQSIQLLPFFIFIIVAEVVIRLFFGHPYPGHLVFVPAFLHTVLWTLFMPFMRKWVQAGGDTHLS